MKWACVGNTGDGKTLAIVLKIEELLKKDPTKHVYANFHINLPNCHFTPIMFLPFDKLHNCIIAYDDVSSQEVLERFIGTLANKSRKKDIELIFTCQYYTMIPRNIRRIIDFRLFPQLNKKTDTLTLKTLQKGKGLLPIETYHNVIAYIKKTKIYDTNEVVDDPTESEVLREIARISEIPRDIEKNLMIFTGNKADRKSLYKEIYELKGFNKEEKERLRKKKEKEAKIRKQKYLNQKNQMINYLVKNIDLNESKTYIKGKIYEKLDNVKSKIYIEYTDFSEIIMRAFAIFRDREILQERALEEKNSNEKKINITNDLFTEKIIYYHSGKGFSFKKTAEKLGSKEGKVKYYYYKRMEEIEKAINNS